MRGSARVRRGTSLDPFIRAESLTRWQTDTLPTLMSARSTPPLVPATLRAHRQLQVSGCPWIGGLGWNCQLTDSAD
eukprot:2236017-Rhodomonas_salina.2